MLHMLQGEASSEQVFDEPAAAPKPPADSSAQHSSHPNYQPVPIELTLQKDAYLVFRALCKLSHRTSENSAAQDQTVLKGKVGGLKPSA